MLNRQLVDRKKDTWVKITTQQQDSAGEILPIAQELWDTRKDIETIHAKECEQSAKLGTNHQ